MSSNKRVLIGFIVYNYTDHDLFSKINDLNEEFHIFILDNSTIKNFSENSFTHPHVFYRKAQSNHGAAGGARLISYYAVKNGYDYLVLFDQDTNFSSSALSKTLTIFHKTKYGICYAISDTEHVSVSDTVREKKIGILSGTILKVSTLRRLGCYKSFFFMEGFDLEFSLRCIKNQVPCCSIDCWKISQKFGSGRFLTLINNKRINCDDHLPWRYFYRGFSMILLVKMYLFEIPIEVMKIVFAHSKSLVKVVLFESNKFSKIIAYSKGVFKGLSFSNVSIKWTKKDIN